MIRNVSISGNQIAFNVEEAASGKDRSAVWIEGIESSKVSNNYIEEGVVSGGSPERLHSIFITNSCKGISVAGNHIRTSVSGATGSISLRAKTGSPTSFRPSDCHVVGNEIYVVEDTIIESGKSLVYVEGKCHTIAENKIRSSGEGTPIVLVASPASSVCDNSVIGGVVGISADLSSANISLIGNSLPEGKGYDVGDMESSVRYGNSYNSETPIAMSGVVTLVAGTASVSTAGIWMGDRVILATKIVGGTVGFLYLQSIDDGVGFVVNSTSNTDTSDVYWEIVK